MNDTISYRFFASFNKKTIRKRIVYRCKTIRKRDENDTVDFQGGALIIPSASTKDPYKGVLPSAGAMRPSLVGAKISVDSLRRYVKAFSGFSFYLRMHWELHDSYADHVFEFVNMAFETGHQTKSGSQLLLAFFPFICDDHKAITSRAYQALKSWNAAVPTQSHPPLPWPLALLFAWDLVNSRDPGDVDTGLGLLVAHHVYARGGELDALTVGGENLASCIV